MILYATDYDGTLNCRGITPELKETLSEWRAAGNLFGVVSGRPYPSLRDQIAHDGLTVDFLAANNGAILMDGAENLLEAHSFPADTAEALIRKLAGERHSYFRMDAVRFYRDWNAVPAVERRGDTFSVGEDQWSELTEITVDYPSYEASLAAARETEEAFGGAVRPLLPGPVTIDFVPGGAGKALAVKRAAELFGGKPERILTTGDSLNDLDMLTDPAFEGYAVEFALPALREKVGRTVSDPVTLLRRYL